MTKEKDSKDEQGRISIGNMSYSRQTRRSGKDGKKENKWRRSISTQRRAIEPIESELAAKIVHIQKLKYKNNLNHLLPPKAKKTNCNNSNMDNFEQYASNSPRLQDSTRNLLGETLNA